MNVQLKIFLKNDGVFQITDRTSEGEI
jgi:hypothetical protein